jgi:hypothetical protein
MRLIRYLIVCLLLCCGGLARAQGPVPSWGGGADQQDLSFGFTFQYLSSDYKVVKNPDWRKPFYDTDTRRYITDSLTSISSNSLPGFAIGFITRYTFNEHIEIRTTPQLVFSDKILYYKYKTEDQNTSKQIQSTSVDIPLSLKIKSDRLGDFRLYVLGGLKYSMAINKKPNEKDVAPLDRQVQQRRNYSAYEAGIGCDIYFEYFKLSPEFKLSNSFNNVLLPDNHPYSLPLSKLFLHTISFSLYFE